MEPLDGYARVSLMFHVFIIASLGSLSSNYNQALQQKRATSARGTHPVSDTFPTTSIGEVCLLLRTPKDRTANTTKDKCDSGDFSQLWYFGVFAANPSPPLTQYEPTNFQDYALEALVFSPVTNLHPFTISKQGHDVVTEGHHLQWQGFLLAQRLACNLPEDVEA